MADEITLVTTLSVRNGNNVFSWSPGALTIDQAAVGGPTPGYVTIGTSEESIAFGELSTQGVLCMQNLDATNYVRWGFSTGVYGGRLMPGEYASFRLNPGSTLYLVANTAACKCVVYALEN
jgi:hypothetical protein